MSDIRVADFATMTTLIENGREAGFNRQISQDVQDALDPEGTNIIQYMIPHEHIAGQPADLHIRAGCFLKLVDDDSPNPAVMDIAEADWRKLPFAKP